MLDQPQHKRRRGTGPGNDLAVLTRWLAQAGVTWSESCISILPSKYGGFGVFATADIAEGAVLATIPKSAVLSVRNAGVADVLCEAKLGGGLGLVIAVMYERSIGARSPWHAYLHSFGRREYLPLFWSATELQLLRGTEAEARVMSDAELSEEDFTAHVLPLAKDFAGRFPRHAITLENFQIAASWVSSRAFGVDAHHGMSLVPMADIFNHKAAVVNISADYVVNPVCFGGVPSSSDSDDGSADGADGPDGVQGNSVQHRPARPALTRAWLLSEDVRSQHRLEIAICDTTNEVREEVLEIVAASTVAAGVEVHNTYGELGNEDLVVRYGFALAGNPFTAVHLSKASLVALAETMLGGRALRRRARFLLAGSELLHEHLEPFEVLPGGVINAPLHVTLFVLLADEQRFTSWSDVADAVACLQRLAPSKGLTSTSGRASSIDFVNREVCKRDELPEGSKHEPALRTTHAKDPMPLRQRDGSRAEEASQEDACIEQCTRMDTGCGGMEVGNLKLLSASEDCLSEAMRHILAQALSERMLQHPEISLCAVDQQLAAAQEELAASGGRSEPARARVAAWGLQHSELQILMTALLDLGCSLPARCLPSSIADC